MKDEQYLTVQEVADRYKASVKSVYLWVRKGILPALRITPNAALRFRLSDLEQFERERIS